MEQVEEALRLVHSLDPAGVGARNLRECLLLQIESVNGKGGVAWLIVSSYLPELLGVCDRLAVMARGRLSPVRPVADWSPERVMAYATGEEKSS